MGNSCLGRNSDKQTPSEQSVIPLSAIPASDQRGTDQPGSDQLVTDQPNTDQPNTDKQSPNVGRTRSSSKRRSNYKPSPQHEGVSSPEVRKTDSSDTSIPVDGEQGKTITDVSQTESTEHPHVHKNNKDPDQNKDICTSEQGKTTTDVSQTGSTEHPHLHKNNKEPDQNKELSAVNGDGDQDIADLSDPNRPTKLAEHYSELFENQWKNAFSELKTDGFSLERAIELLLNILIMVYKVCEDGAQSSYKTEVELKLKQMTEKRSEATEVYTNRCLEICRLMCLQNPPVFIDCDTKLKGQKFDKSKYKEYTKSGPTIDYVVWPVLYLHKDRILLCKGTAQCIN